MPDAPTIPYTKLPGSGVSSKGVTLISAARVTCSLWLGDDHLLQVESTGGYSESYKRFYFRDIQALTLRKTKKWFATNLVLGVLTGLFLLWALAAKTPVGSIVLYIFTTCFGIFLLANFLLGATCTCHLKTAVHLEQLPSLRRRRHALKVLAQLQPLVAAVQGNVAAETLAPQYDALLAATQNTTATTGQHLRLVDPSLRAYASRVHLILFSVLLVDGCANVLNIFLPGIFATLVNLATSAALAGAVVIALVKQHETNLKPAVRGVTWVAAGFTALGYLVGYIMMVVMIPAHKLDGTQWGYLKGLAALQPLETPWWLTILIIGATVGFTLGALGLLLLQQHWREQTPVAPPPPA
jgi:hypothetical protein